MQSKEAMIGRPTPLPLIFMQTEKKLEVIGAFPVLTKQCPTRFTKSYLLGSQMGPQNVCSPSLAPVH